jgi:hypothetical protein
MIPIAKTGTAGTSEARKERSCFIFHPEVRGFFSMFGLLALFASQSLVKDSQLTWDDLAQVIHLQDVKFSNESICEDLRGFLDFLCPVGLAGRGGSARLLEKRTASQFPFDETLFSNGLRREEMGGRRLFSRPFSPMGSLAGLPRY